MDMKEAIKSCFSKYAIFTGRASRSEFWWFQLFLLLVDIPFWILSEYSDFFSVLLLIYLLATIIPIIAVWWRRMHDVDCSGWFSMVPVYGLILACFDSNLRANRFGPVPRDRIKNFPRDYQRSYDELERSTSSKSNEGRLIVCGQCSSELARGQNFCHMCGIKPPPCCNLCGTGIRENAMFCGNCGSRVTDQPPARSPLYFPDICGHCGYRLTSAQKFCMNCGRSRN